MKMIEHVVLYRFKPDAKPSEISTMMNDLNGLNSIDQVVHLNAGPLRSSSLTFSHMLHCRYNSKDDLNAYTVHPLHVSLVKRTVIIDDIMAVDWITESPTSPGNSVLRVVFLKLKDGLVQKDYVLELIRGTVNMFTSVAQFSFGENFSPNRAKGFSIAVLMVFNGVDELDLNAENIMISMNEKLSDLVEDELVLEYIYDRNEYMTTV